MTTDEILKLYKVRHRTAAQLERTREKLHLLQTQVRQLEHHQSKTSCVSIVHKNKPLQVCKYGGSVYFYLVGTDHKMKREANIYINAHNEKTWGISVMEYNTNGPRPQNSTWLGADYPSAKYVRSMALDFCAGGWEAINARVKTRG